MADQPGLKGGSEVEKDEVSDPQLCGRDGGDGKPVPSADCGGHAPTSRAEPECPALQQEITDRQEVCQIEAICLNRADLSLGHSRSLGASAHIGLFTLNEWANRLGGDHL
jgi:hypothetical protein